jgi:uncharacterized protein
MRWHGAQFHFSPSDLASFLGCEHLTQLEVRAALGEIPQPHLDNPYAGLIARKGDEHEQRFLESLAAAGHAVTRIELDANRDLDAAAKATVDAIRRGVPYIHQAVFVADNWRGRADFLERVPVRSALGDWSYVILDTKLARSPRPEHALQVCFYSHCLAQIQSYLPGAAYLVLGTSSGPHDRIPIRLADVSAYYRRLGQRFETAVRQRTPTTPYPCDQCTVCRFRAACCEWWEQQDSLVRIAGVRRDQISRLSTVGIGTLTALAEAAPGLKVRKMAAGTFEGLREQAALQLQRARSNVIPYQMRPVEDGRGLAALPRRSRGDVILDLEGHPFYEPERGLEFLFSVLTHDDGTPRYEAFWAHDRAGERLAFEAAVDLIRARLARYPDLHVYHFGAAESVALKRLMGEYATRELEIDDFLRRGVFVNLHPIVRQALRAGVSGYSLKDLEPLIGYEASASIRSGTGAVLEYERWLATREATCLTDIAAYNQDDCRATLALLDWLHARRPQELPWPEQAVKTRTDDELRAEGIRQRLRDELLEGAEEGQPRWLAAHLLEYHRREARPAWWAYFDRMRMTPEELIDDAEAVGGLEPDLTAAPEEVARSLVHTLRFPPQDHKFGPGSRAEDPATGEYAGEIVTIDGVAGVLRLKRGPSLADVPLPAALVPPGPVNDGLQRDALLRFATSVRDDDGRYPALQAILAREHPRVRGRAQGSALQTTDLGAMKDLAATLDRSYLFVQGPPGAGKTWTGGRLVADLLRRGKRVGIASQSHKAIHNLLDAIQAGAREIGVRFSGAKKSVGRDPDSEYESEFITSFQNARDIIDQLSDLDLVAGTPWLFPNSGLDNRLDYLVIDEAGQVSLADAIAMGTAARNIILLGDPLQLAQVSQGTHPAGCEKSVLEHLLGEAATIPNDRGLFLERSFRMHPDVCKFVSEVVYDGRLRSADSAARRTTSFGTGIRFIGVDHQGNRSSSDEEVREIAVEVRRMLGGAFIDADGSARTLAEHDFMVVTPYNAQVRQLRAGLPAGVRVGTVDKFQGREAPIVFFSMATSSGEDVPRRLAFLFSRNRLNVAVSRAQCLAYLVCSPRLLETDCQSIEEMKLVNALCRLVEYAEMPAAEPALSPSR